MLHAHALGCCVLRPHAQVLVQQGLPAGRDEELLLIISGEVSVTVDPSGLPTLLGASPKVPNQVAGAKQGPRRTTMAGTTSLGSVQVRAQIRVPCSTSPAWKETDEVCIVYSV